MEVKEMKKVGKLIFWVVIGLSLIVTGGLMLIGKNLFLFGIPVGLAGFWVLMSIKIVGSAEMAVFVLVGEPIGFRDSGPRFVLWLFARLKRYPKKMYKFNYPVIEVITKAGEYGEPEKVNYGSQVVKVKVSAYLNFPREREIDQNKKEGYMKECQLLEEEDFEEQWGKMDKEKRKGLLEDTHPLIKILRAEISIKDEELEKWTADAVVSALRIALGQMTWKEGVENIAKVNNETEKVFKKKDGALIKAGFRSPGIRLVVTEIDLSQKLKDAMVTVDEQRLQKEAAPFEAEQEAEETGGAVIQMFCKMTGMLRVNVENALRENPKEFVKKYQNFWEKSWDTIYRRMGIDGKAYLDIRTQNPLLDLIALWQRMPMGGGGKTKQEGEEGAKEEKREGRWPALEEEAKKVKQKLKKTTKEIRQKG